MLALGLMICTGVCGQAADATNADLEGSRRLLGDVVASLRGKQVSGKLVARDLEIVVQRGTVTVTGRIESADEARLIVNSICGCAAGSARPGVMLALQHQIIPDNLGTVFAGQDHEAVEKARSLMTVPPSSPMVALFENGRMIFALQRSEIEGSSRKAVANDLTAAFDKFCSANGPSCPPEVYEKIIPVTKCGSKIPVYRG